jgi:hypothetical protein
VQSIGGLREFSVASFPRSVFLALFTPTAFPLSAFAYGLPDPKLTPGAINESVAEANIRSTICKKGQSRASAESACLPGKRYR